MQTNSEDALFEQHNWIAHASIAIQYSAVCGEQA